MNPRERVIPVQSEFPDGLPDLGDLPLVETLMNCTDHAQRRGEKYETIVSQFLETEAKGMTVRVQGENTRFFGFIPLDTNKQVKAMFRTQLEKQNDLKIPDFVLFLEGAKGVFLCPADAKGQLCHAKKQQVSAQHFKELLAYPFFYDYLKPLLPQDFQGDARLENYVTEGKFISLNSYANTLYLGKSRKKVRTIDGHMMFSQALENILRKDGPIEDDDVIFVTNTWSDYVFEEQLLQNVLLEQFRIPRGGIVYKREKIPIDRINTEAAARLLATSKNGELSCAMPISLLSYTAHAANTFGYYLNLRKNFPFDNGKNDAASCLEDWKKYYPTGHTFGCFCKRLIRDIKSYKVLCDRLDQDFIQNEIVPSQYKDLLFQDVGNILSGRIDRGGLMDNEVAGAVRNYLLLFKLNKSKLPLDQEDASFFLGKELLHHAWHSR